jgi:hypothetical protein
LWKDAVRIVCERMKTKHRGTTPYHPRTNGMVERLNGVLGKATSKYLVGKPRKIRDLYVPQATYYARIRTHTTTESSPFKLLYGVHPRLVSDETDRYQSQRRRVRILRNSWRQRGRKHIAVQCLEASRTSVRGIKTG